MKTALTILLAIVSANATAQVCKATTPIQPGTTLQWCSGDYCGATPEDAALRRMVEGRETMPTFGATNGVDACDIHYTLCGCAGTACGYYMNANKCTGQAFSCTSPATLAVSQVAASCSDGYTLTDHRCVWDRALEQDAQAKAAGGLIDRDAFGNIERIEQPLGHPIASAANYDQYGRPGLVGDADGAVLVSWPADGSALPNAFTFPEGTVNVWFQDPVTPGEISAGDQKWRLSWWPNGSLFLIRTEQAGVILSSSVYDQNGKPQPNPIAYGKTGGGPVPVPVPKLHTVPIPSVTSDNSAPTFVQKSAMPFAATTAAAAPISQVGVHPVVIAPPVSATPIVVISAAIGAATVLPMKESLFQTLVEFTQRCFSTPSTKECEDAAWAKYNKKIHRCDDLFPDHGAEWRMCYDDARVTLAKELHACRS